MILASKSVLACRSRLSIFQDTYLTSETFHLNCCANMPSGILPSFLGAVQASLAVLLTISYGVIASRTNILKSSSSRDISKMCVRLFLPALMITNIGKELHADTAIKYVPVLSRCSFVLSYSGYVLFACGYTTSDRMSD
jgi:hypothetical protein